VGSILLCEKFEAHGVTSEWTIHWGSLYSPFLFHPSPLLPSFLASPATAKSKAVIPHDGPQPSQYTGMQQRSFLNCVKRLRALLLFLFVVIVNGGFAEYCAYPAGRVFKIKNLSDVDATLLEPASCACHGLEKIAPRMGSKVLMFGMFFLPFFSFDFFNKAQQRKRKRKNNTVIVERGPVSQDGQECRKELMR
jgi:hypothetical protein